MDNNESMLLTIWKSFHSGPQRTNKRSQELKLSRRSTRNSVAISRRNIGVLTPINSPCPTDAEATPLESLKTSNLLKKTAGKATKNECKVDPRAELLRKWQMEKNKRKQEEKLKIKPLFKVSHISSTSTYNLDNVYKQIKGKPIDSLLKKDGKNKLQPIKSHTFKAPANIHPIDMKIDNRMMNQTPKDVIPDKSDLELNTINYTTRSLRSRQIKINTNEEVKNNKKKEKQHTSKENKINMNEGVKNKKKETQNNSKDNKINTSVKTINFKTPVDQEKMKMGAASSSWSRTRKSLFNENPLQETEKENVNLLDEVSDSAGTNIYSSPSMTRSRRKNNARRQYNRDPQIASLVTEALNESSKSQTSIKLVQKAEKQVSPDVVLSYTSANNSRLIKMPATPQPVPEMNISPFVITSRGKDNARKEYQHRFSQLASPMSEILNKSSNLGTSTKSTKKSEKRFSKVALNNSSAGNSQSLKTLTTPVAEAAYISPFVTTSRGKDNARRDYLNRMSQTLSPMSDNFNNSRSPQAAARYFTMLLNNESQRLTTLCNKWNDYKLENPAEEVGDMINVAVGQTELLLNKKFKQFQGLIKCCETGESDMPVTCLDLHGFWDTMTLQITNLEKRFEYLNKLKENNWDEITIIPKQKNKIKAKTVTTNKTKPSSSLKAMIEARRQKLKEESESSTKTPAKRKSRLSVLGSESKKRLSSPGLTMMKVTQAAKSSEVNNKTTPADKMIGVQQPKSILKSEPRRSIRKSKAVLFQVSPVSQIENDPNSPNVSSPPIVGKPARRSTRTRRKSSIVVQ